MTPRSRTSDRRRRTSDRLPPPEREDEVIESYRRRDRLVLTVALFAVFIAGVAAWYALRPPPSAPSGEPAQEGVADGGGRAGAAEPADDTGWKIDPALRVLSPAPRESFIVGAPVPITATVAGEEAVGRLMLVIDGRDVGSRSAPPWAFRWNAEGIGEHRLWVRRDDGPRTRSAETAITVRERAAAPPPPPPPAPAPAIPNGSFATGSVNAAPPWESWLGGSARLMRVTGSGEPSSWIRMEGDQTGQFCLWNRFDLDAGTYRLRCRARSSGGQKWCLIELKAEPVEKGRFKKGTNAIQPMPTWTDMVVDDLRLERGQYQVCFWVENTGDQWAEFTDVRIERVR